MSYRHLMICAAAAMLSAASVHAADLGVSGGPPSSGGGLGTCAPYFVSGSSRVSGSGACTGSSLGNSGGSSSSDFGRLGADAVARQFDRFQSIPSIWASGASFQDGVTFTSSDPTAVFADVSLNMHLDGTIAQFGSPQALDLVAEARVGALENLSLIRISPNGSVPILLQNMFVTDGGIAVLGKTDVELRTSTYRVALNQPLFFSLNLTARVGAGDGGQGQIDFANTFRVPLNGAVFTLPAGVTANAGSWLVNNQLAAPVPEPQNWVLMIGGLGLSAVAARRARRTTCFIRAG